MRAVVIMLFAALPALIGLVWLMMSVAHAAVAPKQNRLSVAPVAEQPVCVERVNRTRVLLFKDGRAKILSSFTLWEQCK